RFDHFGSAANRLFVSALANNTVEVIDISARTVVHTITGIPNPLDVVFSPETNKLFAGSSRGKLYIYDGTSFDLLKEIDFHSDVDNLRYDAANKRVYVGYGEDETGAIGAVDATTNERRNACARAPRRIRHELGSQGRLLPCVLDTDDLYYDAARKRIYVAGGEGFISVFQQKDADHYQLLAKVPSALGARTAGYFGKGR